MAKLTVLTAAAAVAAAVAAAAAAATASGGAATANGGAATLPATATRLTAATNRQATAAPSARAPRGRPPRQSQRPTRTPTRAPTRVPSPAPSRRPTRTPTRAPTPAPTRAPTRAPAPTAVGRATAWRLGDGFRKCTADNARVRKEVRDLTAAERTAFTAAVRAVMDPDAGFPVTFSSIHRDSNAHGSPIFLPWHRLFLLEFEDALRSIDPSVAVPYWQWSSDWRDPAASPVWSTGLYGGSDPGECIPDGPFANLRATVPTRHCVRRGFTGRTEQGMGKMRFEEPSVLAELIGGPSNFSSFTDALEFAHGAVHVAVGGAQLTEDHGDMWYVLKSANDPAFYSHHAFVDQLWAARQAAPNRSHSEYGGVADGRAVRATDEVAPFGVTVRDSFSLPCVTYAELGPGPQGRSGRPPAGGGPSQSEAEKLVEAFSKDKLWPMELFARGSGMSEEKIRQKKLALKAVEVAATVKGNTAAAAAAAAGGN